MTNFSPFVCLVFASFGVIPLVLADDTVVPINFTNPVIECAPTTFQWQGGQAPFDLTINATKTDGIPYLIGFQVPSNSLTIKMPFAAGSNFYFYAEDSGSSLAVNSPTFTVNGGNDNTCVLTAKPGSDDEVSVQEASSDMMLQSNGTALTQCTETLFQWTGGTPPFDLQFSTSDSGNVKMVIEYPQIMSRQLTIPFPYAAGTFYYLTLKDSHQNMAQDSEKSSSANGAGTNCLINSENNGGASQPSPSGTINSHSTSAPGTTVSGGSRTSAPSSLSSSNGSSSIYKSRFSWDIGSALAVMILLVGLGQFGLLSI